MHFHVHSVHAHNTLKHNILYKQQFSEDSLIGRVGVLLEYIKDTCVNYCSPGLCLFVGKKSLLVASYKNEWWVFLGAYSAW